MRRPCVRAAHAAFPARLAWTLLGLVVLAGCGTAGSAHSTPPAANATSAMPSPTGRQCGTGRTAANVPVLVEINHGPVACATAMAIEQGYAAAVASGKVPGNGGAAPVHVEGWLCQGFNTPQILQTGDTSKCTKGTAEIVAILPPPSGTPTP